jgi:DNA repair exonuclease SbcCD ATPase subunit
MIEDIKLNTVGSVDFEKGTVTLPFNEWEKYESNKKELARLINYMQDQIKIWDSKHGASKHTIMMNGDHLILAEYDENTQLEKAIIQAKKDLYEEHKELEESYAQRRKLEKQLDEMEKELYIKRSKIEDLKDSIKLIQEEKSKLKQEITRLAITADSIHSRCTKMITKWYSRLFKNDLLRIIEATKPNDNHGT